MSKYALLNMNIVSKSSLYTSLAHIADRPQIQNPDYSSENTDKKINNELFN